MKRIILTAAATLFAMAGIASAQVIGVAFNNDASAANHDPNDPGEGISPTFTGKGVLGESFIGIHAAGTGIPLSDGVTLDITSTGSPPAFRDQPSETSNDLFRAFVQADTGQTLTITLHGLTPNRSYKLAGYAGSSRSGRDNTTFTGALTGTTVGSINGQPASRSDFVLNVNYVTGTASADASGVITFTISGTEGNWPVLNGFGIAPAGATPSAPASPSAPAKSSP